MKNIPVFTTKNGAASLILKEIPYRQESYIHIQSSQNPLVLLDECVSFCRACGAEKIYASGDPTLTKYPIHTRIWEMRGELFISEEDIPSMFPVTETTVEKWRSIYNEKMKNIDNASTLESRDEKRILESGGAYFVHDNGNLLGIGWMIDQHLEAIASVRQGAGELLCKAMQSLIPQQQITLEVASTNTKAVQLYERLGFIKTGERSIWYRVL